MKFNKPTNEITPITIDAFMHLTQSTFEAFIFAANIATHPSIFLEGKPGVGKSQSIKALAHALKTSTGKNVLVTDIRLLLFNPVDLRGIPVVNAEKSAAIWLKPYIFDLQDNENTINILFLDELTAAPLSVQAAAYQIVLDRRLGEHVLPANTFVIAAGNGPNDGAISQAMPSALKNRFIHYKITEELDSWMIWAKDKIHSRILTFLQQYPHEFTSSSMQSKSNIIITPRSWEMLSTLLKRLPDDHPQLETLIASVVGSRIAHKMLHEDASLVQSVIAGTDYQLPDDIYSIHQLTEHLEMRLEEFIGDKEKTRNVLAVLNQLPLDYAITVFKAMMQYDAVDYEMETIDHYQSFLNKLEAMSDAT